MGQTPAKKVLVVDDEANIVHLLTTRLAASGYVAMSTTSGREAVTMAKEFLPDVILLDIVIPDLEGTQVAAILAEDPTTKDIPIVFLTGRIITKDEQPAGKKVSRHYFIAKPITTEELLDTISQALAEAEGKERERIA